MYLNDIFWCAPAAVFVWQTLICISPTRNGGLSLPASCRDCKLFSYHNKYCFTFFTSKNHTWILFIYNPLAHSCNRLHTWCSLKNVLARVHCTCRFVGICFLSTFAADLTASNGSHALTPLYISLQAKVNFLMNIEQPESHQGTSK